MLSSYSTLTYIAYCEDWHTHIYINIYIYEIYIIICIIISIYAFILYYIYYVYYICIITYINYIITWICLYIYAYIPYLTKQKKKNIKTNKINKKNNWTSLEKETGILFNILFFLVFSFTCFCESSSLLRISNRSIKFLWTSEA